MHEATMMIASQVFFDTCYVWGCDAAAAAATGAAATYVGCGDGCEMPGRAAGLSRATEPPRRPFITGAR